MIKYRLKNPQSIDNIIRNQLNLSDKEFAAQIGISRNYFSKIMHGHTPGLKARLAVAKGLGAKTEDIFVAD
mgnify:CR=1 FL=1